MRNGCLLAALRCAEVIAAACIAVYRFGLLDSFIAKSAAAKPAPNNTSANLNSGPPSAAKLANPGAAPGNSVAAAATQTAPYASNAQKAGGTSSFGTGSVKVPFETNPAALDVLPKEARRRTALGARISTVAPPQQESSHQTVPLTWRRAATRQRWKTTWHQS